MATAVIMPRQGQSVESCIIGKWHKKKGDPVQVGDLLFTYETDKATFDETAKTAGVMLDIFFAEGDDIPVLTNVCVIGEPGESAAEFNPNAQTAGAAASAGATAESAAESAAEAPAAAAESASAASAAAPAPSAAPAMPDAVSPRARGLAERSGADLRLAEATGPKGRVIERDVRKLIDEGKMATAGAGDYPAGLAGSGIGGRVSSADVLPGAAPAVIAAPAPAAAPAAASAAGSAAVAAPVIAAAAAMEAPETYTEKHSNIRKVIARSMQASLAGMAQLTLNSSFDATDVLALRSRLKKAAEKGLTAGQGFALAETVPTLNDIILYAVSRVLLRHPACNAHYDDEKMTFFRHVHLGVAVDTPRGLMVPTLSAADSLPLAALSRAVKELAASCQKGTISPDLLKGGTFTVTNLGTLDVESFTPVINPPQTCILGVNNIVTRVRETDGVISTYPAMGLSLTFDHRAVDGAPAARFLKDLKQVLENFSLLLMQ